MLYIICRIHEDIDDQVVHMKNGKINDPTLDLLADAVEASSRTDKFTPEMRTGCRNDNEIRFATLFKRIPVGNETSHPKCGHNKERIVDSKRARHIEESLADSKHARHIEENLADSKRVSSDTSVTAGKSPCQNKDMDIEEGDPEIDIESQEKQFVDPVHVSLSAPVVKSFRGHTQMLPLRFCDSLIEPLKKIQTKRLKHGSNELDYFLRCPLSDTNYSPAIQQRIKRKDASNSELARVKNGLKINYS